MTVQLSKIYEQTMIRDYEHFSLFRGLDEKCPLIVSHCERCWLIKEKQLSSPFVMLTFYMKLKV